MSFENARKSDRFQIITAILFMGLFAALLLILAMPRNQITGFVCNSLGGARVFTQMCSHLPSPALAGSEELVASHITSACLDSEGLRISVAFAEPLVGASNIQVFTTGDDYFPSEQGISDSFRMSISLPDAADHLDILIPVDSMPVGEQIFGNILIRDQSVSSFVAYSIIVPDCSINNVSPATLSPEAVPTVRGATCLPDGHLMLAFLFEEPVLGQYRVLVDETPYQLASVINQPATLFFSGDAPPEGPVLVRLISATDDATVFEETYTPPVCGGT
ncbi:MAG TPA: hypothetical protein VK897_25840 [Anaerolineales bacterium]|nr:hypothetical protein [Anaerolineales bacterium]